MRITRLRLAGFGPYRGEQQVDFTRFDADGIFLITGRTGAGKSSILDAVCFALYGDVPRYDGRERQVRSQHCGPADPSEVELDLLIGDAEYRIRRTPKYERAKRTGTGTTTAEPEALLSVRDADGWRPVATRPKEVAAALAQILPIRRDQFLQVILLAQNRFQEFLLAPTEDRRSLLRTLFGTSRFERLELDLLERRRSLGQEVADVDREIRLRADTVADLAEREPPAEPGPKWFEDAAAAAGEAACVAEDHLRTARRGFAEADARFREAQSVRQRQVRRDDARARLADLAREEPQIAAARAHLEEARRAETALPQLQAADRAATEVRTALAEQSAARAGVDLPPDAQPDEVADGLLTMLGGLERAAALEQRLPELQVGATSVAERARKADDALHAAEQELAAVPARAAAAGNALAAASAVAGSLDGRLAAEREVEAAFSAAEHAVGLAARLADARVEEAAASAANRTAAARYDDLMQRRVLGQSFELAAALAPGRPCPVCGSVEHPAPATTETAPVTAEDVEAARSTVQQRQRALAAAGELVVALEQQHALALARAGGLDAERLAEQLATAQALTTEAREAVQRRDELVLERDRLETSAAELRARVASLHAARTEIAGEQEAARAALAGAQAEVAAARGPFGTVEERIASLRAELDSVRRLERADRAVAATRAALTAAAAALDAQLAALGFPDRAAAGAARLDPSDVGTIEQLVRTHDEDRAAATAVLAEPELQDLPDEPVDPEPFGGRLDDARAALETAIGELSRLAARAESVREAAAAAVALLRRASARRVEYRQLRDLAATVHGDEPNTRRMRLETYVLAAQLEQILAAANLRLGKMTSGRYALELDDERQHRNVETGLGIAVRDAHTGQVRQAASLSGGEMFLASLALALGLAEVVSAESGGVTLDTLFVDEGFGSLDGETLDVAMAALDDLRAGGRTIGLISHVESMQDRIAAKLQVEVLPTGDSRVLQHALV